MLCWRRFSAGQARSGGSNKSKTSGNWQQSWRCRDQGGTAHARPASLASYAHPGISLHSRCRQRDPRQCGGRQLSEQADYLHRSIRCRQHHRRHQPHHRPAPRDRARRDGRGRGQAGRERRDRGDLRRARGAGWLHRVHEHQQPAFGGAQPQQERALRPGEGFHAGHANRQLHFDPRGQSGHTGKDHSGADRLCQGQSGQADIRQRQHLGCRRRRDVQVLGRHQPRPCALSKLAAGGPGRDRRPGVDDVHRPRRRPSQRPSRQAACAGGDAAGSAARLFPSSPPWTRPASKVSTWIRGWPCSCRRIRRRRS